MEQMYITEVCQLFLSTTMQIQLSAQEIPKQQIASSRKRGTSIM